MGERDGIAAVLADHLFGGDGCCEICKVHRMSTKGVQPCAGNPRKPCRPMLGGETGEDDCGPEPTCPERNAFGALPHGFACTADDARGPA